jgi:TonB family protein
VAPRCIRELASVLAALVVLLVSAPSQAAPEIQPPKAIDTPAPTAPPGTDIAPALVVELVVSKTGEVTSAKVLSGDEALAASVEEAALTWRFEPALRDGAPVAAKIRMRVELRLPELAPPKKTDTPNPPPTNVPEVPSANAVPAAPPPTAAGEAPVEVTVRGTRPLAPHVELLSAEIREMPGAFGDAFRAIEALPGVTPVLSGVPYFVIRGAPPGNTGYFLDGIRVPALFHFAIGEAVIHPALVESVNLYPSVYPAHFGRFAGGILSGETVPPADKFHGEASLRLIDTGALLETPFAGGRGDALVSGRVGYPGLLLRIFDPSVELQYYDYQARASYRFHDGSELRVFGFGSYDSLSARQMQGGPIVPLVGIEFERFSLRYTEPVGATGEVRVEATVGHDRTSSGNSPPIALSSESYSLKSEMTSRPSEMLTLRTGVDVVLEPYHFDFHGSNPNDPFGGALLGAILPTAQDDLTLGVYGELGAKLSRRVEAEFGLRGDLFMATYPGQSGLNPTTRARQVPAADPRLTVRYKLTRAVSWISAVGMAHQPSNIPLPVPALTFSQLARGLQTAYQASEGVEAKLPWGFTGTATVFGNDFAGLAQLSNNCAANAPLSCAATTVHGEAFGLEILLRRNLTERLTGWLSYTLSRSERDYFDGGTGRWSHALSEYDRPQVANLIVAYDLGAHWRAGARLVAYAGSPYATGSLDGTPNARTPPFFRLDLRLEKRWIKSWGHISFIAEWLNALIQKEQFGLTCADMGTSKCTPALIGPITVPSLGVEVAF